MKYNRALDFTILSLNAGSKGNTKLSAKLFAKAIAQPDFEDAIRILEASNDKAHKAEQELKAKALEAKAAAAKVVEAKKGPEAAKRIKASEEEVIDDPVDGVDDGEIAESELGADLVEDDDLEVEEEVAGDLSDVEDAAEDATEDADDSETDIEEFAALLSSMQKRARR